jgi:hypothetical protein
MSDRTPDQHTVLGAIALANRAPSPVPSPAAALIGAASRPGPCWTDTWTSWSSGPREPVHCWCR